MRTVGDGFVVQNNLAPEIHVDIVLHVGGTLAMPQLAGDVRPTDGRFNIPFMRGDFDLVPNVNHVTFIATKSIADGDTPDIHIEATNLVTDANGADHNVHMRISGPLREAQIDLSSDDGLDRNQTAFLLFTGRTSVSTSSPFGTQNATVGANLTTGADIAGQATRDTVANLMEPYIDDTFQRLTGLNLRLTVGSDGFEGRIRKRVSRYWRPAVRLPTGIPEPEPLERLGESLAARLLLRRRRHRADPSLLRAGGPGDAAPQLQPRVAARLRDKKAMKRGSIALAAIVFALAVSAPAVRAQTPPTETPAPAVTATPSPPAASPAAPRLPRSRPPRRT